MNDAMTVPPLRLSKLAVSSLVFSLMPVFCVIGIVLGVIGVIKIGKPGSGLKGRGLAIAGIAVGSFMVFMTFMLLIIAAVAIPGFASAQDKAKISLSHSQIKTISSAIALYQADNNRYPETLEELVPQYLDSIPKSPWNTEYVYTSGDLYCIECLTSRNKLVGYQFKTNEFYDNKPVPLER